MVDKESNEWINIQKVKDSAYCIEDVSLRYFELHKNWPVVRTIEMLSLRLNRRLNILEVGCGSGADSICLALLGHTVTAIDISPSIVDSVKKLSKKAKELYPDLHIDFKIECGNIFDLSKYKCQFDLVFNFGVIQIWKKKFLRLLAIQNMKKTLKEEGWIYVAVTNTTNPILNVIKLDSIISDMAHYNLPILEKELALCGFETIEKGTLGLSDTFKQWVTNKYLRYSLKIANAVLERLPAFLRFPIAPHVSALAKKSA